MNVSGIRGVQNVSSGNDYSAGYEGHSPVGTWVDSDSWSGLTNLRYRRLFFWYRNFI